MRSVFSIWMSAIWIFSVVVSFSALAQSNQQSDPSYSDYYTVDDSTQNMGSPQFETPLDLLHSYRPSDRFANLNLLQWIDHKQALAKPTEKYNRKNHFGTWIRQGNDCQNTRAKVLIRDSQQPVEFTTSEECTVQSGYWVDPYSNRVFTDSKDIQIDHVVPLKHAYETGAWTWINKKRCVYANFISNDFHLLAVSGHENQSKGDKSPDGYLPPNNDFVCSYIKDWLRIKMIWNLALVPPEASGIATALKAHNCSGADMVMTKEDLLQQRSELSDLIDTCEIPNFNQLESQSL